MFFGFISLIIFILLTTLFFSIPGFSILDRSKSNLSFWEKILLGTPLGLVIFSLIGYLVLTINLKALFLPVILTVVAYSVFSLRSTRLRINFLPRNELIILSILLTAGIIGQLLVISPSGINTGGDILFWSSHAHDSSWHIALMNQLQKGWPLQNPAFSGERVVNYHFFSDIAPSYFSALFGFSPLDLYFRFFPFLYAVLFGSLAYLLGKRMAGNFWGGFWSIVFADFGGSAGFIITLLRNHTIGGESIFWSSQPQSTIGNPPQIVALILLLTFLIIFQTFLKEKNRLIFLSLFLIGGSLVVFKVYAGIALLGGLGLVGTWQIIKEKKIDTFALFLLSSILSLILYIPNSAGTTSFLIFQPWWYVRTMVVSPDRLGKLDWEFRRQTYIADQNWKRVIQLEGGAFLIFFFGNLWTRTISLLALPKFLKSILLDYFNLLFFSIIFISFLFPMLFLQKGVASNTSQFFQYFLLLSGTLAGVMVTSLSKKIKSKLLKILLGGLIIILSLPTQLGLLMQFYCSETGCTSSRPAFTKIDAEELQALNYLKEKTPRSAVILNPPFNQYLNSHQAVPPIWDWSDTDYIGAFGDRATYLSDQEQVDIMGYNYQERKKLKDAVFSEKNPIKFEAMIRSTGADYIYFPKLQSPQVNLSNLGFSKEFENGEIEIWKIR